MLLCDPARTHSPLTLILPSCPPPPPHTHTHTHTLIHRVWTRKSPDIQNIFFLLQTGYFLTAWLTMVFTQNSSILHWGVHQPIAFSQLRSLESHKAEGLATVEISYTEWWNQLKSAEICVQKSEICLKIKAEIRKI